jgi:signal transduction histidine kinase/CheY-like chemotaxis protein/methylphosphotriester-DNA--protein-cysteine methyltransferase
MITRSQVSLLCILLICGYIQWGFCGNLETEYGGTKYTRNFSPVEYDHYPQNWCIQQDHRGVIYVGNQAGLMEYDGVSWRIIYIPNLMVRSMTIDKSGSIYVGGKEEMGFFNIPIPGTGSIPRRHYHSLKDHAEEKQKDFSIVQRTHWTEEGIYFRTAKLLFRWQPDSNQMAAWEPGNRFHTSFTVNGKFYIRQVGVGLMQMEGSELKLAPGGELFADKKIYMMANYTKATDTGTGILIGTRDHGFYIYADKKAVPFPTEADSIVQELKLYHGIRLKHLPDHFALATLRGGVIIMNSSGQISHRFHKENGLQDNTIYYIFEDKDGNLWLALSNGITRIELASPLTIYDRPSGLPGLALAVVRHEADNNLYVGTSGGLFKYAPKGQAVEVFKPVPEIPGNCRDLLSTGPSLLAATSDGVWSITEKPDQIQKILTAPAYTLRRSLKDNHRIWVGNANGLVSLKWTKKQDSQADLWVKEFHFETIGVAIGSIIEEDNGNLWLGSLTSGAIHVTFPVQGQIDHPVVTRYNKNHGLPKGEINIFQAADHIIFASEKGIYRFNQTSRRFIKDMTLGERFCDGSHKVFRILTEGDKIWFHAKGKNYMAQRQSDGSFALVKTPLIRVPLESINGIYPEKNRVWFAGNGGLIRYDRNVYKDISREYRALIREVAINGRALFYDSKQFHYKKPLQDQDIGKSLMELQYKDRNIRFRFAAPFFEDETATMYRYRLEGYDQSWSPWSHETQKDYTNLDSGMHRFRTQAKNVYGHLSGEAYYDFKVLPPWNRTWWAFSLYGIAFILLFFLAVKRRSAKLEREKQKLEKIVQFRTGEVNEKNLLLQEKSRQLEEMAQVKSRFFANISHEFRTPLTLIMGPLDQMLSDSDDPQQQQKYGSMLRNTERLLHLIDQLLELSKFESGRMKLHASLQDIIPFLKGILYSFELVATQKQLQLTLNAPNLPVRFYFDAEKLDKILCNLLSNAVKFTPPQGAITVTVTLGEEILHIVVHNSDSTIPASQLPHIFDRFYQANSTDSYEGLHKGSGIGLALVKELVTLHYGEIEAKSDSSGTKFELRLPMGKSQFKPEEIMDLPETFPSPTETLESTLAPEKSEPRTQLDSESGDSNGDHIDTQQQRKNLILVVEDNAEVRSYIAKPLNEDYRVLEAVDGQDGLDKARNYIPDLIISDIMMPRVDGFELCQTLKQDVATSHIPIILLTAKASDENIIKGIETGADDYITKPFNIKILHARIKNLIELRSQAQQKIKRRNMLQPDEISVSNVDELFLKELHDVCEKYLSNPDFHVEKLSKKLYMSRATLYRKIIALTGESPNHFIRSYRLKRAAQLLTANFGNITEVAMAVGFTNMAYFSKCFKEAFHQLPSNYTGGEKTYK